MLQLQEIQTSDLLLAAAAKDRKTSRLFTHKNQPRGLTLEGKVYLHPNLTGKELKDTAISIATAFRNAFHEKKSLVVVGTPQAIDAVRDMPMFTFYMGR
ncbi:hypothetical protein [Ewingella americana]|uniref:Uncharacterized protein n=1 Tax=Ewingella americana TaxID=41202 RepID=A0A502GDZ4_9GAMM|nr:hypothetical protein [Ewingella americana]TPG59971.1 hypothetical protein EAH77_15505 [Ewingella americana]